MKRTNRPRRPRVTKGVIETSFTAVNSRQLYLLEVLGDNYTPEGKLSIYYPRVPDTKSAVVDEIKRLQRAKDWLVAMMGWL